MVSTIGFVSINPVLPYWDCLTPACPWTWSPAVWQPIWSTWLGKHFISDSAIYIKRKQKSIFLWYCLLSFVYINTAAIWSRTVQIQSEFCSFWDKTSCQPRVLFLLPQTLLHSWSISSVSLLIQFIFERLYFSSFLVLNCLHNFWVTIAKLLLVLFCPREFFIFLLSIFFKNNNNVLSIS